MNKYDTQICILSGQVDPNLLPILDGKTRPKKVIVLVSEEMKRNVDSFTSAIDALVDWEIVNVPDAYDIEAIENQLIDICADLDTDDLVVNITGGTKPMSIAAFTVCTQQQIPCFYIDTNNIVQLFAPNPTTSGFLVTKSHFEAKLNEKQFLKHYLQAHDFSLVDNDDDYGFIKESEFEDFISKVLTGDMSAAIKFLNYAASVAKDNYLAAEVKKHQDVKTNLILETLESLNWIKVYPSHDSSLLNIQFSNEKIRRFLNGIWLEIYIERQLKAVLPSVRIYRGLKAQSHKFRNELDIVFFYDNKVYIIEAKTLDFEIAGNEKQDVINKLSTVKKNFGGLNARAALVSFLDVPPELISRATKENIAMIKTGALRPVANFQGVLKQWIKAGSDK